jgi:hypothetical protein
MRLNFFFFFIWGKGSGGLAIAIPLTCAVGCMFMVPILSDLKYELRHGLALGCMLGAIILWFVSKRLAQPKTFMDAETGATWEEVQTHSLYSIPVKYWPFLWVLFGVLVLVV